MENHGSAIMPLHYGHPPEYLYKRMVKLGGIISDIIIQNYNENFLLDKIADPFWFHSFSLAIGFDWNSSGTTTATLSALKDHINRGDDLRIVGGKGKHMGNISQEIEKIKLEGNIPEKYLYRIKKDAKSIAKVDEKLLQDGFDLYMQFIIMDYNGNYAIVEQGMNQDSRLARRYHWKNNKIPLYDDGRNGISGFEKNIMLDLSTKKSMENRKGIIDIIKDNPLKYSKQRSLDNFMESAPVLDLNYKINWQKMKDLFEYNPDSFQDLMEIPGLSKSTIRALSYLSELVYGNSPSFSDPVKYSFCLGGKDGVPKPVNVYDYDKAIEFYNEILKGNQYYNEISKRLASMSYRLSGN
ncbi:DUF763 domain-containing protein [Ferroplasma sp.]|uniref:DUF763 domain-containing protein n=1 Tax=Ferroplasma sp. TaxID=2591003 RepID=UPI00307E7896